MISGSSAFDGFPVKLPPTPEVEYLQVPTLSDCLPPNLCDSGWLAATQRKPVSPLAPELAKLLGTLCMAACQMNIQLMVGPA